LERIYDLFATAHGLIAQVETAAGAGTAPGGAPGAPPAGARPPGCGGPEQLLFMLGMLVLFYFLLIRPQQKRAKQHKQMVESLKRGDNVITSSGIYGRIVSVDGNVLTIEIAKNTQVRILKGYVGGVANDQTAEDLNKNPQAPQPGGN
jgi:preprotein translocase subunit YajC